MKKEKKISLIIGSHAHVPSGAPETEFEYIYENRMRPFIVNLYRYSNIQAVMHYSGVLLYWVERTHPEFFMLIEEMVSRRQAEIIGGGFYEPILPLIPLQDRIGQIELLTTYLRKHFGKRPLGCWIPGMAWEQHLAAAISASDMNHTFLSQQQFSQAGLSGEDLFFPCITEDQGKLVTVFPVSSSIEAELAKKSCSLVFENIIKELNEAADIDSAINSNDRIISVFPENVFSDPEEAPDTAWNRFFEELSLSKDFVETVLPYKILRSGKVFRKASFPNSSALADGFSPRRYIIEHDEANGIYSKMIFTNVLISQLKGDKYRKQNAREELWKAQDSCIFTPGNSQLRHEYRKAAYSSLIRAERLSREKGRFIQSIIQHDFDLDGVKEYLFQDAIINCYIQTKGAGIFELDYLPKEWNYLECGCAGSCRRTAFSDVILPPRANIEELGTGFPEGARLCFNEQYDALSQNRKGISSFKLSASADIPFGGAEIVKSYSLKKDILNVSYILKNTGKENMEFCFMTEIDFSFAGMGEEYVRFYTVESGGKDNPAAGILTNTETIKILDVKNEVQILLSSANVFSGSLISACINDLYQTTRIITLFPVTLESGKTWTNEFNLKFSH